MKRLISMLAIFIVIISYTSCKRNQFSDLEYSSVSTYDWLQANVQKKDGKDRVLWFQVFDQIENKSIVEGYQNTSDKVGKYPAKIFKNKWIWMLINNRIEIRLLAEDAEKEFQNTDKLRSFIEAFDLKGMEKISGAKVDGKALKKYIPKLDN